MKKLQHLVAVVKEDVNEDNSNILRIFDKWLQVLFSLLVFGGIPYFLYLIL
ncbi:hypothetical protein [Niallia taxi]|uniref:hypothetical protein n=1 Tax=Niallia taxi TaxID=2499688 RepID=UPI003D2C76F2